MAEGAWRGTLVGIRDGGGTVGLSDEDVDARLSKLLRQAGYVIRGAENSGLQRGIQRPGRAERPARPS